MTRYRKRPVVIDAVRWLGDNETEIVAFTESKFNIIDPEDRTDDPDLTAEVFDRLHSTWVGVHTGDWIIKGVQNEFYPCVPDVFDATYEPVA